MPTTVYDPDGKPVNFDFDIDARQAVKYAGYTTEPPQGKEQPEQPPLERKEHQLALEAQERARVGIAVTPEERELINKLPGKDARLGEKGAVHEVGSYPEGEHPGALGGAALSPDSVPGSPPGGLSGAVANAGSPGAPVTAESASEQQSGGGSFDPATADRAELLSYLKEKGEEPPKSTSTSALREMAAEKAGK